MSAILITGAGGFIGRNLSEFLSPRFSVLGTTRSSLNLLDANQVETFFSTHSNIQTIIHCASVGGTRVSCDGNRQSDIVDQNLRMYFNLIRCLQPHQRMIVLGSGAEYGRPHYFHKMPETYFDTYIPTDGYGFAKALISKYSATMDNILCLRIFGIYGRYEDYRYKFISNAIVRSLIGETIHIAQNVVFDYLYMPDFANIVAKLLSVDWPYRHINVTPTLSTDLVSLARIIQNKTGKDSLVTVLNPGLNIEYTGDNSRLRSILNDFSFTAYRQGIAELVDFYQNVIDQLDLEAIRRDEYLNRCEVKK